MDSTTTEFDHDLLIRNGIVSYTVIVRSGEIEMFDIEYSEYYFVHGVSFDDNLFRCNIIRKNMVIYVTYYP